jgi:glycosyltransferase involved in cell wall biosynthesis
MIGMDNGHLPKIWMNVTTSANWNRAAVGVVRVEQELCKQLENIYSDRLVKCVFEKGELVPYTGKARLLNAPEGLVWPDSSRDFPRTSSIDPVFDDQRPNKLISDGSSRSSYRKSNIKDDLPVMEHGDIVVSVGLDWDHSYIDQFYYLKKKLNIKIITCCYDLIPVLYPQYCVGHVAAGFKEYFGKLSWSSSAMLCISNQSRDDYKELVRRIGAPEIPSVVIPLGDNVPNSEGEISREIYRIAEKPYILFVSTIERRKNHEVLYRAYHLLAKAGHAEKLPKLVLVGMPGWGVGDLLKDIELDPLTDGLIIQLNHIGDAELGYLYRNAEFMVYPSLYEGWGLPIGEALASGKAVIASGRGSIPEVGGDLVVYVDPWNAQAWADEILRLVENPEQLKAIEDAVTERYIPRTWADTAMAVKGVVDSLEREANKPIVMFPGYDMRTMVGTPHGETMRSSGDAGIVLFGPYWPLSTGSYELTVDIQKVGNSAGYLKIDVVHGQGNEQLAVESLQFQRDQKYSGEISIQLELHKPIKDLEIRCEVTEGILVSFNKIVVKSRHKKVLPIYEVS